MMKYGLKEFKNVKLRKKTVKVKLPKKYLAVSDGYRRCYVADEGGMLLITLTKEYDVSFRKIFEEVTNRYEKVEDEESKIEFTEPLPEIVSNKVDYDFKFRKEDFTCLFNELDDAYSYFEFENELYCITNYNSSKIPFRLFDMEKLSNIVKERNIDKLGRFSKMVITPVKMEVVNV